MPLLGRPSPRDERMLIVFASPLAASQLDQEGELAIAMFIDTLALARAAGTPVLLSLAGESYLFDLPANWTIVQQPERDLGERLAWSIGQAFERGARRVVLIGVSVPQLSVAAPLDAFAALADHDVVLGPTDDGRYSLIGLDDPAPWLFDGMPWDSDDLLAQTRARLEQRHKRVALLPTQHAIRSVAGAQALEPLLRDHPDRAVLTAWTLRRLFGAG